MRAWSRKCQRKHGNEPRDSAMADREVLRQSHPANVNENTVLRREQDNEAHRSRMECLRGAETNGGRGELDGLRSAVVEEEEGVAAPGASGPGAVVVDVDEVEGVRFVLLAQLAVPHGDSSTGRFSAVHPPTPTSEDKQREIGEGKRRRRRGEKEE